MEKIKYNTPYLLDADTYFEAFIQYRDIEERVVAPVYVMEKSDNQVELAIFNEDNTEMLTSCAWFSEGQLQPYTEQDFEQLKQDIKEMIEEWEGYDEDYEE